MTTSPSRIGAIRPDPNDPSPLRIDERLVHGMLMSFLRDETEKAGMRRAVIGVSGGVDSAVVVALAAEAYGADNVLALFTPYRTSSAESQRDAAIVAERFGVTLETVDITAQIEAYFGRSAPRADATASHQDAGGRVRADASVGAQATRIRIGNKMARERKSIEYDRSWPDGLVLGTSNKTELLLGYGTQFGDMASALDPVGDLYKTQLRELALHLGVPDDIVRKAPTADLWVGQTDEGELGFTYAEADLILYHLIDRRLRPAELVGYGFDKTLVDGIRERVRRTHFKRVMPLIAKVSLRTIGHDFLYPRDWEAD